MSAQHSDHGAVLHRRFSINTIEEWCLVIDERGVSGYAHRSQFVLLDENDDYTPHGCEKETLGGFKTGDRIETLIGALDRDYV